MVDEKYPKKDLAQKLNISRSSFYYKKKQPFKDWQTKIQIEEILHNFPSYGHKRISIELKTNKKKILRVMKLYGIKPYRRRCKKPKYVKNKEETAICSNMLLENKMFPENPNEVWVSDFTYVPYKQKFVYLATAIDLCTRRVAGFNISTAHNAELVSGALYDGIMKQGIPKIIHSDQGKEYKAKDYRKLLEFFKVKQSMSRKASPWENGYQESFYSQFKVELGDPDRFGNLGELVAEICAMMYIYNEHRIHSKLKMPPNHFVRRHYLNISTPLENFVS